MKVTILILACLSALVAGQGSGITFNTAGSTCQSASGCNLLDILVGTNPTAVLSALISGDLNLDFSAAGSGLNINIGAIAGLAGTINLNSLAVAGSNTVTIAAGTTVQTANFTVQGSSTAIVNGIVSLTAAANAAGNVIIDSSSALYVNAGAQVQAGAANVVAQGQANVAGSITTTGTYAQSTGNLILNSTATTASTAAVYAPTITIGANAVVSGNGILGSSSSTGATATVNVEGTMNVGNSPGVVTVNGDWRPSATSTFNLEIQSDNNFDRLIVSGKAYPNGFVRVSLLNNYSPAKGTRYTWCSASATQGSFIGTTGPQGIWSSSITANSIIANFSSAVSVAVSGFFLIACVLAFLL